MLFWIIIGVAFYNLANNYGKNKFLYLGIGIGLALITQLLVGVAYGLIFSPTQAEIESNNLMLNVVAVLISGVITFIVYRIMKSRAEKESEAREESIHSFGAEAAPGYEVEDKNSLQ